MSEDLTKDSESSLHFWDNDIDDKVWNIKLKSKDLISGELKITSEIRVDKVYKLSKNIIRKKFGQVNIEVLDKARMKLNKLII